jgi:hypothetical protein
MAIKQTDIRLMELNLKLNKIHDRVKELHGEKTTLFFKMEQEGMHPILFMLKVQAMDFEAMLLEEQVREIQVDHEATKMVAEMGIDFAREDF